MRVAALALAASLFACGPQQHAGTGTVREVQAERRQLVLAHEPIPDLMPAMTMSFDVPREELLSGLAPGDRVRFRLVADGERFEIVALEQLAAGAEADPSPGGLDAVVPEADPAPAFELVDQDGRPLSLASLRGQLVLLDFVYTACPGPCPILTSTHVRVQRELPEALRDAVRLVSISIDPERDTPAKLRAYAEARGADLASWSFLTGSREAVAEVTERYGVGSVAGPRGEIEHVVVTFLIDREGRIAKRYFGVAHDADEVLLDLAKAARG